MGHGDTGVGGHVSQGGVGGSSSSPLRPCDRINPHNGQRELILHDYTSGVRGGTFGKARKATASDGNDDGGGNNEEGGANDSGTSGQSPSSRQQQQQPTSDGASPNAVTLANLATLCANLGRGDEALAHGRAACRTVTRQLEANVAAVVAALRAAEVGEGGPTSPPPSQQQQKSSSSSSAATVVRVTAPFPEALEMAVTVLTAIAAAQMSQRPQTAVSTQSAVVGSSGGGGGGGARHVLGAMPNERAAAPRTYRLALGLAEATLGKKHPMTAYCRRCVEGL